MNNSKTLVGDPALPGPLGEPHEPGRAGPLRGAPRGSSSRSPWTSALAVLALVVHELEILREENEALRKALHGMETVADFERQDRVRTEAELAALKYPRAYIPPGGERTEALMALAISQAEERGAKWALERHGNPFASKTLEQYAAEICRDARGKP